MFPGRPTHEPFRTGVLDLKAHTTAQERGREISILDADWWRTKFNAKEAKFSTDAASIMTNFTQGARVPVPPPLTVQTEGRQPSKNRAVHHAHAGRGTTFDFCFKRPVGIRYYG